MLEKKVYNNDDVKLFSVHLRLPSPCAIKCGLGCNTLSHSGLARKLYPLIVEQNQQNDFAERQDGSELISL